MTRASRLGPILYGTLFVAGVPALLVGWALATEPIIHLPAIRVPWLGALLAGTGLVMLLAGMDALRRHGHGLPMNAYPPPDYVSVGIYRFVSHPIYAGFVLVCVGVSLFLGSASGMWLVSPVVLLCVTALALGHERHDLRRRFGSDAIHRPLIALPPNVDAMPTVWDRASILLLVFLPWTVASEAAFRIGVPTDAIEGLLPVERGWPVLVWTEAIYVSAYVLVAAVPFVARSATVLRRFALTGLVATVVVTLLYLAVPVAAFPAFHVIWTLIAAEAWSRTFRRLSALWWLWALAIGVSCITTGIHALDEVALAVVIFLLVRSYGRIWDVLRRAAELMANSWRQWRVGPIRIINHGFYAGAAGTVGLWLALSFVGPGSRVATTIVHVSGLLGAGLWAQRLEGSSELSRPFGYFGSLVGCSAASVGLALAGLPALLPLAATAAAAPWIQAIGRGRCLVQGCCHGSPSPASVGIRYRDPHSRVVALSDLSNRPLHPTPLYSMLSNVVIGVLLLRLWLVGASIGLIGGLYLILAGVSRFVEESYRGEPQTPIVGKLRLYQWTAIAAVVAGIGLTSLGGPPAPHPSDWLGPLSLAIAVAFGLVTTAAMGVDFPESRRRYARLSG